MRWCGCYLSQNRKSGMKAWELTSSRSRYLVIELARSKFGMPDFAISCDNVENGLEYTHSPGVHKAESVRVVRT
jgi:hypothetical protein